MADFVEMNEQEQPDDIRSALASAFEESEKASEPAPKNGKANGAAETPDKEAPAEVGAEAKEEPAAELKDKEAEKDEEPEAGKEADKKADLTPDLQKAISAWKPADQQMLKGLPKEAQDFVARRYKEMEGDYTKKLQGISRLKTDYEPVEQMLAPYREQMRARGFTPASLVEAWSNVEKKLVASPDSAIEVLVGLQRAYNIPIQRLTAALGIRAPAANGEQSPPAPEGARTELSPEFARQLSELSNQVRGLTSARQEDAMRSRAVAEQHAENEANKFRSATDDKGNLRHPHIDEVESDMLAIVQARVAARQPVPPMEELYETAVWANPSTRAKLLTAQKQAEQQQRQDQAKAKAAAAKKAAVSVTGAPGAGQATASVRATPERSLREELEESLANLAQ